jgi:hypothetical protein
MAGMTPAECYTTMQGTNNGLGMGLTTYDGPDADAKYTHQSALALEAAGGATRHGEGVTYAPGANATEGQVYIMWLPVAGATPPPPPPLPEPPPEEPAPDQALPAA